LADISRFLVGQARISVAKKKINKILGVLDNWTHLCGCADSTVSTLHYVWHSLR